MTGLQTIVALEQQLIPALHVLGPAGLKVLHHLLLMLLGTCSCMISSTVSSDTHA